MKPAMEIAWLCVEWNNEQGSDRIGLLFCKNSTQQETLFGYTKTKHNKKFALLSWRRNTAMKSAGSLWVQNEHNK